MRRDGLAVELQFWPLELFDVVVERVEPLLGAAPNDKDDRD